MITLVFEKRAATRSDSGPVRFDDLGFAGRRAGNEWVSVEQGDASGK